MKKEKKLSLSQAKLKKQVARRNKKVLSPSKVKRLKDAGVYQ
jgi:hypothetical protein